MAVLFPVVAVRSRRWIWPAGTVALAVVAALIPLAFHPRYYFVGDTEAGAYGQWYAIGTRILQGRWTDVLDPHAWQAGVLLADGAWGFFSPVQWAIGLATHLVPDALVVTAGLKVVLVAWAALGTYVLARSFGVPAPWATIAGIAAPLSGWAFTLDLPSFITGAISWSFLPWAWAGLRAFVHRGRPIALAVVPAALLIGIVYTHATLSLILVTVAVAVEALLARAKPAILRAVVGGTAIALMAVIAHLPALLVYPSTGRVHGVENDGILAASWTSLSQGAVAVAHSAMTVPGGLPAILPYTYIAWFLPLAAFISWRRLRPLLLSRASLVITGGALLLFVQAPSEIGPLRFPARLMPYLAVVVIVLVLLGLSRARAPRPGPWRIGLATAILVAGTWTSVVTDPAFGKRVLIGSGIVALMVAATAFLLDRRTRPPARLAVMGAAVATVALLVPMHIAQPRPSGIDYALATRVSTYRSMLAGSRGDVFVVGSETVKSGAAMSRQAAIGNAWYVTGVPVQNAYTTLTFPAYGSLLCMGQKGTTCAGAFTTLFQRDSVTGQRWVDLFGISTIELIKPSFTGTAWRTVPAGWHIVRDTTLTRVIVRDHPVPGAGDVVWSGAGTTVTPLTASDTAVRFRVDRVGADARVVLSRLPWPGYSATGASISGPVDDMLLSVTVPRTSIGSIVTVTYRPPGSPVMLAAAILLVVLLVAWTIAGVLARRRSRFRLVLAAASPVGTMVP